MNISFSTKTKWHCTWTLAGDTVILPEHEKPSTNMRGIVVTNRCFSAADGVPFPDAAQLRGLDLIKVLGDTTLIYELK